MNQIISDYIKADYQSPEYSVFLTPGLELTSYKPCIEYISLISLVNLLYQEVRYLRWLDTYKKNKINK